LRKKSTGRPFVDANTVDRFREAFQRILGKSIRRYIRQLQIPGQQCRKFYIVVWNCLHSETTQYKHLELDDRRSWKEFAVDCSKGVAMTAASWTTIVFCIDVSTFRVSSIWADENPHAVRDYEYASPCGCDAPLYHHFIFFHIQTVDGSNCLDMP